MKGQKAEPLDPSGALYAQLRDRLLSSERVLLQTLDFDLDTDDPFAFLFACAKKALRGGADEKKAIVQAAYNYIGDSFTTSLCLRYPLHVRWRARTHAPTLRRPRSVVLTPCRVRRPLPPLPWRLLPANKPPGKNPFWNPSGGPLCCLLALPQSISKVRVLCLRVRARARALAHPRGCTPEIGSTILAIYAEAASAAATPTAAAGGAASESPEDGAVTAPETATSSLPEPVSPSGPGSAAPSSAERVSSAKCRENYSSLPGFHFCSPPVLPTATTTTTTTNPESHGTIHTGALPTIDHKMLDSVVFILLFFFLLILRRRLVFITHFFVFEL